MANIKEFRDQAPEELEAMLVDCQQKLFEIRNQQKQTKKLEKPHEIRQNKRKIAQILTILNEQKKGKEERE